MFVVHALLYLLFLYVHITIYKMFIFLINWRVNWRCGASSSLNTSCISLKAYILTIAQFCPNNVFIALPPPSPHSGSNPQIAFNCHVSLVSFNPEQIFCFSFHDLYVLESYRPVIMLSIPRFGFIWWFCMIWFRLCFLGRNTTEVRLSYQQAQNVGIIPVLATEAFITGLRWCSPVSPLWNCCISLCI